MDFLDSAFSDLEDRARALLAERRRDPSRLNEMAGRMQVIDHSPPDIPPPWDKALGLYHIALFPMDNHLMQDLATVMLSHVGLSEALAYTLSMYASMIQWDPEEEPEYRYEQDLRSDA